jgi:D-glycero-D-manno-heptose 1,7-bisphosphate phosphatase
MRIVYSDEKSNVCTSAVLLDRDGVINCRRAGDYVLGWSQFIFTPGIREALKSLAALQLPMIVISNQSAVGRGLLDPALLEEITAMMNEALLSDGIALTAVYYCIHKPADGCSCRKPKPELLYRAAADFNIDLARSVFVGDSDTDIQAARSAGCQPVMFGAGLCSCSNSADWFTGVPTARTAKELFQVAAELLCASKQAFGPLRDSACIEN